MSLLFDIYANVNIPTLVSADNILTSFDCSKTTDDISLYRRFADAELRSIS